MYDEEIDTTRNSFRIIRLHCANETREEGVEYILDADVWEEEPGTYPAFNYQQMPLMGNCQADLKFMFMPYMAQTKEVIACLKHHPKVVIIYT